MFRGHHRHGSHHGPHHGPHHGFGGRWGHRGFGGMGGRRAARMFEQADLRLVLLQLISERPAHGYELIKEIEDRLGGAYSPSPGVVYPTLTYLEEAGFVVVTPEAGGKKRHAITPEGQGELEANRATVTALFDRMGEVRARSSGQSPRIGRAMENLLTALRYRMNAGPLSEEDVAAITAALDAAALAVEKKA